MNVIWNKCIKTKVKLELPATIFPGYIQKVHLESTKGGHTEGVKIEREKRETKNANDII